ncbi:minor capsid protein [Paenibacillus sp. M1]|uniref:Minor capsid protein n=1 Tax=Paenibacillus haidiansis TaxID=1574488 RepID=A0ABU7W0R4_9BACL
MMTLAEIRDWLKTQVSCPQWYIGKIDGSKEQCIGVYGLAASAPNIAIGGLENTSYASKTVSILIHWGKNAATAELKAQEVYAALFGQSAEIGGKRVILFQMRTADPVSVETDDEGFYEYVIETTIYYER